MSADLLVNLIRGFRERAEALEAENAALAAERDALLARAAELVEFIGEPCTLADLKASIDRARAVPEDSSPT